MDTFSIAPFSPLSFKAAPKVRELAEQGVRLAVIRGKKENWEESVFCIRAAPATEENGWNHVEVEQWLRMHEIYAETNVGAMEPQPFTKPIAHIRHNAPKAGGYWSSSGFYYKNKTIVRGTTLCGAECAHYDVLQSEFRTKVFRRWIPTSQCPFVICPTCVAICDKA